MSQRIVHSQGAPNINCSIVVFIFDVCWLLQQVSSTKYGLDQQRQTAKGTTTILQVCQKFWFILWRKINLCFTLTKKNINKVFIPANFSIMIGLTLPLPYCVVVQNGWTRRLLSINESNVNQTKVATVYGRTRPCLWFVGKRCPKKNIKLNIGFEC